MYEPNEDAVVGHWNGSFEVPERLAFRFAQAEMYALGALDHMPGDQRPGLNPDEFARLYVETIDRQQAAPEIQQAWRNVVAGLPIDMADTSFNRAQGLKDLDDAQRTARYAYI